MDSFLNVRDQQLAFIILDTLIQYREWTIGTPTPLPSLLAQNMNVCNTYNRSVRTTILKDKKNFELVDYCICGI
jgi:hypothetical protein